MVLGVPGVTIATVAVPVGVVHSHDLDLVPVPLLSMVALFVQETPAFPAPVEPSLVQVRYTKYS